MVMRLLDRALRNFGYAVIKSNRKYSYLLNVKRFEPIDIQLLGKEFLVPDGMSFYYNYQEVFNNEIYRFKSKSEEPIIIDCGSNCGLSILYFKQLYPKAIVIGFEPDPLIFSILEKNIKSFNLDKVDIFNKALWKENKVLEFNSSGADSGSVLEINNSGKKLKVDAVILSQYLRKYPHIDFLKIDIEGAELEVLNECTDELYKVQKIFVEYHSFKNKSQNLDTLLSILIKNNFRITIHTEKASKQPFYEDQINDDKMDLQLNIFGVRKLV